MPGFDKHVVRVAAAMAAGGTEVSALRGALRGAVHGRSMPVDNVHSGGGASGAALAGLTLLMVAAQRGRADAIKVLLDEFGAGGGVVGDSTSARAALALAVSGSHEAVARALRAWLGESTGADLSEDGEVADDGEDGEVADDGEDGEVAEDGEVSTAPSRTAAAPSKPSVFARLQLSTGGGGGGGSGTVAADGGATAAPAASPKWKKDYSELSFAEKLRLLKAPAAPAAGDEPDVAATQPQAPEDGWVRFGAVHSQWRDQLDIRSDGSFSRVARDDGGRWSELRWDSEEVGQITITWANWDVSDTLHTSNGGATFQAVGTNQWGDEYQFNIKVREVSAGGDGGGGGGGGGRLTLPAWFNPAQPQVQAAAGDFGGGKGRRRDRASRDDGQGDGDRGGRKRQRSEGSSSSMTMGSAPEVSQLKALERGEKFGTLSAAQKEQLTALRSGGGGGGGGGGDGGGGDDGGGKKRATASSSSLDDDMDDYFKK
jgi:hypothetical protein